jgi:ketosteroid isomerase-like protein
MSTIKNLVLEHLELATQDFSRWLDLLDDNIVINFPYGESAGLSSRLEGKPAVAEAIQMFLARVPSIRFNHPVIHLAVDSDEAFATYEVDVAVPENGRSYHQKYISHIRQRNGKIITITEYYDPTKYLEALGA